MARTRSIRSRGRSRRQSRTYAKLRKEFRAEARKLRLTETEYLNLILRLSKTLRTALPAVKDMDIQSIVKWVEHPLFPLLIQWISTNVAGALTKDTGDNESKQPNDSEATEVQLPPAQSSSSRPPQPYPIPSYPPQPPYPQPLPQPAHAEPRQSTEMPWYFG